MRTPDRPARSGPQAIVKPTGFSPEASATWDRMLGAIGKRLKPEDAPALETFCRSVVLLNRCLTEAAEGPLLVTLENGVTTANQVMKCVPELRKLVNEGCRQFGLSPVDREKLSLIEEQNDEFEDFLKAGPNGFRPPEPSEN